MKVQKIYFSNLANSPNFTSKVKRVLYGSASDELKDQIDVFEETHSNATLLGSGLFSKVFKLKGQDVVIKESLPTENAYKINGNFNQEATALGYVPSYLNNSQRLIADVQTEKGNYYLVSTLVQGTKPGLSNNWQRAHFNSLFDTLFELDKAHVLHNDLNRGNCLISKDGSVGIIDYQWAEYFSLSSFSSDKEKFRFPNFMAQSNAQMFEMSNLPFYLSKLKQNNEDEKIRETFVTYLNAKSSYCQKRANYLRAKKGSTEMDKYERLQAKFLKNPSDDVIELEALKLQMLYGYRQLFSAIDSNNPKGSVDILKAIPACLYVANCGREMEDLADKLSRKTDDKDYKAFLSYEERFGNTWKNWMLNDLKGVYGIYEWIKRNASLSPSCSADDIRDKIKESAKKDIGEIDDVFHAITQKTEDKTGAEYHINSGKVEDGFYCINQNIKNSNIFNTLSDEDKKDEQTIKVEKTRNDFIKSFNETYYAVKDGRMFACVSSAMKSLYLAKTLEKQARTMSYNTQGEKERYAEKQVALGSRSVEKLSQMVDCFYTEARNSISYSRSNFIDASNSINLNDFSVENCPPYDYSKDMTFDF